MASQGRPNPSMLRWLPLQVLIINLAALGLIRVYSSLNMRPFLPAHHPSQFEFQRFALNIALVITLPLLLSLVYLWPVFRWIPEAKRSGSPPGGAEVPPRAVQRMANAPVMLTLFSLLTWVISDAFLFLRIPSLFEELTAGLLAHFLVRPLLVGLIAAAAVYFATEYLCRAHAWPLIFAREEAAANPRIIRLRVAHRLVMLWLAISFIPLGAIAFIAFMRIETTQASGPQTLVMWSVILIGAIAALLGARLALLFSRSLDQPLRGLEEAMGIVRGGDLSARVPVSAADEIGSLQAGFNQMAGRLAESYETLEARNRELAQALDRVHFLEGVKRGLDRFVPDTVRRLIEENPDNPALARKARDVTVLFLDIEGYTRLSEELSGEALSAMVEKYFSLFLTDIWAGGGDINETAGDGLMILFQEGDPRAHALSAARAALAVREKTEAANREPGRGHPPLAVNIGIASGVCDVGSTRISGAAGERWTFTATGPVTNLAARLGDHADCGQILLGPETVRRMRGRFRLKALGPLALKNLHAPVEAFEVEGEAAHAAPSPPSSAPPGGEGE